MNNAGIGNLGTSWDGIENWRKVFDVNLFGYVPVHDRSGPMHFTNLLRATCRIVNVQQTFVPVCPPAFEAFVLHSSTCPPFLTHVRLQSMIHQENPALVINTGSKQGITNPPYV